MSKMFFVAIIALAVGVTGSTLRVNAIEKESEKVLRHIVMFQFTSEENAAAISQDFVALEKKISLIQDFEWGTNVSKENLDKGLTHIFTLSFGSQADLDAYIVHPAHKDFVSKLDGKVADVCVVDYWAQ